MIKIALIVIVVLLSYAPVALTSGVIKSIVESCPVIINWCIVDRPNCEAVTSIPPDAYAPKSM